MFEGRLEFPRLIDTVTPDIVKCANLKRRAKELPFEPVTAMDKHALAILEQVESWDWPLTSRIQESGLGVLVKGGKFKAITSKLLSGFIAESIPLGGTIQFIIRRVQLFLNSCVSQCD